MEWGLFDKTLTPCLNSILRFNLTSSNSSKITSQIKISYKDHRKFTKRSSRLIVTLLEGWFSTLTLSKNSDLASGASSIPLLSWEYFSLAISILLWWCEYCSFASILVFLVVKPPASAQLKFTCDSNSAFALKVSDWLELGNFGQVITRRGATMY